MELEEAIEILNKLKEEVALFSTGWKNKLKDDEKQAIETVLQALENSIPTKKIENEIEILKAQCGGNVFHIQQTLNAEIRLLQKLLEENNIKPTK